VTIRKVLRVFTSVLLPGGSRSPRAGRGPSPVPEGGLKVAVAFLTKLRTG